MRRRPTPAALAALTAAAACTAALTACGGASSDATSAAATHQVTVFAAASLAAVMDREVAAFRSAHPGVDVRVDAEGTQQLLAKLEAEPSVADVLVSADVQHMEDAHARGLVGAATVLARNRVVVAVPRGDPGHVGDLGSLGRPGLRIVVADPSVPVGAYALSFLDLVERNGDAPHGFAAAVRADVVSREDSVAGVVAKLESGVADAGIVYATDVAASHGALTALAVPAADTVTATYPMAVTTHAADAADATAFEDFLRSPQGRAILAAAGFDVP